MNGLQLEEFQVAENESEDEESSVQPCRESEEHQSSPLNYDKTLEKAGFGLFNLVLTIVCGWANMSDSVQVLCVSFLLPAAQCDLSMSSTYKGFLSSSIFVGMMLGGYIWGSLADVVGRRFVLIWCLSINAISGLLSSFTPWFWAFLFLRLMSGIGVGGSIPVLFTYFAEFQPRRHRGKMMTVIAFCWVCGNVFTAALALLVLTSTFHVQLGSLNYASWRLFTSLCSIPALTSAVTIYFMPESPKFYVSLGEVDKAVEAIKKIHKWNRQNSDLHFESIISGDPSVKLNPAVETPNIIWIRFVDSGQQVVKTTVKMFKSAYLRTTILFLIVYTTFNFGYYGLWLWLPELFNRMREYGGSPCNPPLNQTTAMNCSHPVSEQVFYDSLYTSVANIPGSILIFLVIDSLHRKYLLSVSLVISGVSAIFIVFLSNINESVAMACVFGGITTISWSVLGVITTELYPTDMRSSAFGFLTLFGRISAVVANILFGILVNNHCAIPIILVTFFVCLGGVCSLIFPRKDNEYLD